MPFPHTHDPDQEYLHWVKKNAWAKWNLVCSGILAVKWNELGVDPKLLEIAGPNDYGYDPLTERIAARYSAKPENVVPAQGTSLSNFLIMSALLERGDRVLVESPAYEPLYRTAQFIGAELDWFERRREDCYRIDPERVAAALTPRTKLIIVTNLHNPSGVFTNEETLRAVGKAAEKVGAWILVDEAYQEFIATARPAFLLNDNFVSTSSLTKFYGLGGLRCGWVLAPAKVAERARRITNYLHGEGVLLGEIASMVAFDRLDWLAQRSREHLATNRTLVDGFIAAHRDHLEWVPPDGGTICFPRLLHATGDKLAALLREKYETSIVAGDFFSAPRGSTTGDCAHHVRISFGSDTANVREGLSRVGKALVEFG